MIKKSAVKADKFITKQIKDFEKQRPEIAKTMELLEISMDEYTKAIEFINPVKVFSSSSTAVET